MKKKIIAYGFPCIYGGANSELYHQIILWQMMGLDVEIIPDMDFYIHMPLYDEMVHRGVRIHRHNEWDAIRETDTVIAFCKKTFLDNLPFIRKRTAKTIYVNCMDNLTRNEILCVHQGLIACSLYQNETILKRNAPILKSFNTSGDYRCMPVVPYFHSPLFPYVKVRSDALFCSGRISRRSPEKYSSDIRNIYEEFSSPKRKKGIFIGFSDAIRDKTGNPPPWIETHPNTSSMTQQEFYRRCDLILQPMDTVENWPRIGFEAMSSGSVLIVDNRGGWNRMVEHGRTGWLCDTPDDFIKYASLMASEPGMRDDMAQAARERVNRLGGYAIARRSWEEVFSSLDSL